MKYTHTDIHRFLRTPDSPIFKDNKFVASLYESGDDMLIMPTSNGGIRTMAELAVATAQSYPDKSVSFDFNTWNIPAAKTDSVTDLVIRYWDNPDGRKAGYNLDLVGKGQDFFEAELSDKSKQYHANLFDLLIDAVRLSRQNEDKAIHFSFNGNRFSVTGKDDAEELERTVPEKDRVAVIPPYKPQYPMPEEVIEKVGAFTIIGRNSRKP